MLIVIVLFIENVVYSCEISFPFMSYNNTILIFILLLSSSILCISLKIMNETHFAIFTFYALVPQLDYLSSQILLLKFNSKDTHSNNVIHTKYQIPAATKIVIHKRTQNNFSILASFLVL